MDLDGVAQAELVRRREVSAVELVDAAIAALERVDPVINAVVHPRYDQARAEAAAAGETGAFAGVPILVKDLDGTTAGDPFHAGSEHLRRHGHTGVADSHVQARLRAAGMIVLGRTNTPELGLLPVTEPVTTGPTRNPWHTSRTSGGSSGGSAAAVAARAVAIAHAADGGGSIRIPASACGLVGLLPSRGRTSLGPEIAEGWGGWVRRHVVTRSVRDTAAVLDVVHGWRPGDPYGAPTPTRPFAREVGADPGRRRVGVLTPSAAPVEIHPGCAAALDAAAALLGSAGHDVVPVERWLLTEAEHTAFAADLGTAYLAFAADEVDTLGRLTGVPAGPDTVEPLTWALAEAGRRISAPAYLDARNRASRACRRLAAWWADGYDLLVTPTLPAPPPPLGWCTPGDDGDPWPAMARAAEMASFTAPFNVTGQPAISLPLHWTDDGLPVGVQLVAAYGREDLLLRVSAQLEALQPWSGRVPPVHG